MVPVQTRMAFDVDEGIDSVAFLCPKCDREIFEELEK
jgi:hypothetical protein